MDYDRYDAFLHHIFKQTQGDAWFRPGEENLSAGVALRIGYGKFRVFPYENLELEPFETAVSALNPVVAVKVRSAAVHAALADVGPEEKSIYIDRNTRIQIMDTMLMLPHAEKEQCAAFIRDERVMVVWSDDLDGIIPTCKDFEDRLIKLLWRSRPPPLSSSSGMGSYPGSETASVSGHAGSGENAGGRPASGSMSGLMLSRNTLAPPPPFGLRDSRTSTFASAGDVEKALAMNDAKMGMDGGMDEEEEDEMLEDEKFGAALAEAEAERRETAGGGGKGGKAWIFGRGKVRKTAAQRRVERLREIRKREVERPVRMFAPVYNGIAVALSIYFMASGINIILQEWLLDGSFIRFALLSTLPILFCVSLFFSLQIVQNLSYAIGPIAQYHTNSKYYSALPPRSNKTIDAQLPHVTIQMPVYKESLEKVLAPSIDSLRRAMQTYARQGGSAAIFVNDDGLQLLSQPDRDARIAFYAEHGIGWVARPKHEDAKDGFKRAGRFKKASNMNYALAVSLSLERHLKVLQENGGSASASGAGSGSDSESGAADLTLEDRALQLAVEEEYAASGHRHRPWAAHGRACRMGEIVLLVDSDTVVPADCLRDAARELGTCPTVGILQHASDVMQVAHHYFENGMAYFTRRINKCISITCANGEIAPFVGHNAFLRWRALQDAAFVDPADGKTKIWSENNVSEDFDMALRLMMRGYIVRWATYSDGGFKEGVSLTVDDELNRWQKYAYGCSELLFNPIAQWWRRGPVTSKIHHFLWSGAPVHYKVSMLAYMFSYYGLAGSVTVGVINYVLLGFEFPVDGFYRHSFEIWLATTVVFLGLGNLAFTLLEYRLGQKDLVKSLWQNVKWIPFFFFFFGGLAIHLSQAILAHLFSYNMTWAATKKEVERSNFFKEVPKIFKRFRVALIISVILIAGIIVCSTSLVPLQWRVGGDGWAVIFPIAVTTGCHILFPIVLNPWLMIFSY